MSKERKNVPVEINGIGGTGVKVNGNVGNGTRINGTGGTGVEIKWNSIQADTMPIALSLLCLALSKKLLTRQEFEFAVDELIKVTSYYKQSLKNKDSDSRVKLFNENRNNRIWGGY